MQTLLAVNDLLSVHALVADPVLAQSSQGLVNAIRSFMLPIIGLVCGICAISYLFSRQMTQFIIFAVIAVGVFAIFLVPDFLANLGEKVGSSNSNW